MNIEVEHIKVTVQEELEALQQSELQVLIDCLYDNRNKGTHSERRDTRKWFALATTLYNERAGSKIYMTTLK